MIKRGSVLIGMCLLLASCVEEEAGLSTSAQWAKDMKAIDAYLLANGITAMQDAKTGIRIKINELGTKGLPPNNVNLLKVNYAGTLLSNGSEFDHGTTYKELPNFILGWQVGLAMLPEGTKATLYIPSYYGYGTRATTKVPANSNLIFDIDLESVVPTNGQNTKFKNDTTAISEYLTTHAISATKYDSGIWYTMLQNGEGDTPNSIYSQVRIRYTVKQMASSPTVYVNNLLLEPTLGFSSRLVNFPQGVMIGLQLLKEGDKAAFYVPSVLGYGTSGYSDGITTIPSDVNLIFEIELLEVIQ